jgi:hypothetical protein
MKMCVLEWWCTTLLTHLLPVIGVFPSSFSSSPPSAAAPRCHCCRETQILFELLQRLVRLRLGQAARRRRRRCLQHAQQPVDPRQPHLEAQVLGEPSTTATATTTTTTTTTTAAAATTTTTATAATEESKRTGKQVSTWALPVCVCTTAVQRHATRRRATHLYHHSSIFCRSTFAPLTCANHHSE